MSSCDCPITSETYEYMVNKASVKNERIWLTLHRLGEVTVTAVISLPRDFTFIPKKVIVEG